MTASTEGDDQAAGGEIDLLVNSVCRLRPGGEDASDPIRVHSVVGRFIEHSRLPPFDGDDPVCCVDNAAPIANSVN